MLLQVIEGAGSADSDVKKQALKLYFEQAMSEPMHGIRASMFFNLERIGTQLGAADTVRLSELEKAVLPQRDGWNTYVLVYDGDVEIDRDRRNTRGKDVFKVRVKKVGGVAKSRTIRMR